MFNATTTTMCQINKVGHRNRSIKRGLLLFCRLDSSGTNWLNLDIDPILTVFVSLWPKCIIHSIDTRRQRRTWPRYMAVIITLATWPNSAFSSNEIFSGLSNSVVRNRLMNSITVSSDWLSRLIEDAHEGTEFIDSERTQSRMSVDSPPLMLDGTHKSYSLVDNVLMAQLILFLCWPLHPSTVSSLGAVTSIFSGASSAPIADAINAWWFALFWVTVSERWVDRLESVEGDTTLAGVVRLCRSIMVKPSVISENHRKY